MRSTADLVNHASAGFEDAVQNLTGDEFVAGFKMLDRGDRDRLLHSLGLRSPHKPGRLAGVARQARTMLRGIPEESRQAWLFMFALGVVTAKARAGMDSEEMTEAADLPGADVWDRVAGHLIVLDDDLRVRIDAAAGKTQRALSEQERSDAGPEAEDVGSSGKDSAEPAPMSDSEPEPDDDNGRHSMWKDLFGSFPVVVQAVVDWLMHDPQEVDPEEVIDGLLCDPEERSMLQGVHAAQQPSRQVLPSDDWFVFGWFAARWLNDPEHVTVPEQTSPQVIARAGLLRDAVLAGLVVPMLWSDHRDVAARVVKDLPVGSPSQFGVLAFLLSESKDLDRSNNGLRAARLAERLLDRVEADDEHSVRLVAEAKNRVMLNQATLFRSRGQFMQSQERLDQIDSATCEDGLRRKYLTERVLSGAGVSVLDASLLPSGPGDRSPDRMERFRVFQTSLDQIEELTRDTGESSSLLVRVARAAFAEIDGDDLTAADSYQAASDLIEVGSVLGPALRFHRGMCLLRLLDSEMTETAWRDLVAAVDSGFRPDKSQWMAAHDLLSMLGSGHRHDWLDRAVVSGFDWRGFVPTVVDETSGGDIEARRTALHLATNSRIPASTRFDLLVASLQGTFVTGTTSEIELIVDAVEDLLGGAANRELDRRWGLLLSEDSRLREEIGPVTADLAGVQLLRQSGRIDEAFDLAERVFWRVQSADESEFSAGDVLGLITELGVDDPTLDRLRRACTAVEPISSDSGLVLGSPVKVTFVGGNEKQAVYDNDVDRFIFDRWDGLVTVHWEHPGWGTNWSPVADRVESMYPDTDALVLMTFVRTNLGRRLRRTAGESGVPWVACTGHGQQSVIQSVVRAVHVTQQRNSG